ncbi:uncharacterized protein LOC135203283 isoform X3 [Macrobrachium nipponense]|uniref:uncharacterized protein LOC135203283 isoform X3 n=1 Tax=Macrobrachium nipponense TaxID=159736 RepID=UPI0030C86927
MGMRNYWRRDQRAMSPFEGIRDFLNDLFNRQLLILKCIYILLLAAFMILWPHFTIHQKALGLTEYQTGITMQVTSVLYICQPFFTGVAGDKIGNYRILMAIISMITGVIALLFPWIPSAVVQIVPSNISDVALGNLSSETSSIPSPNRMMGEVDASHQQLTFWIYITVRSVYGACNGATLIFFDAAVMANVQKSSISYGYQRAWGTVGAIISSYLSGVIVEKTGGFNEIFYASAGLQMVAGILMLGIRIDYKVPATSLTKDLLLHCFKAEVLLFFGAVTAAGLSFLQDPWWVLPLQILESVVNGLLFTVAIMYCTVLFPTETITSARGVIGILYSGIGRLLGITVGSEILERLGHIITFRIWACIAFASTAAYFLAFIAIKNCRSRQFSLKDIQGHEQTKNSKEQSGIYNEAWDGCI